MAAESESDATRRPEAKDGSGTRGTGARSERGRVLKVNCSVWGRGHWCLPCPDQSSGKWPTKRSWRVERSPSYRHTAHGWQSKTSHYSRESVCNVWKGIRCESVFLQSVCNPGHFFSLLIFLFFSILLLPGSPNSVIKARKMFFKNTTFNQNRGMIQFMISSFFSRCKFLQEMV